jgi:hypothetical protein
MSTVEKGIIAIFIINWIASLFIFGIFGASETMGNYLTVSFILFIITLIYSTIRSVSVK